jgi:pyridoxamine 5'-phosphate oxidase
VVASDARSVPTDPIELFRQWFAEAHNPHSVLPNAMALATSTPNGYPSTRFVLLKHIDSHGFIFFSNYDSRKGRELEANPHAAAAMFWTDPRRQIRIEGVVTKIAPAESDAYFATRDRGSQVGAWASAQSKVIAGRAELERHIESLETEYLGRSVPRPQNWGGYRLFPNAIEFWSEGEDRLHDRLAYRRDQKQGWIADWLAP